MVIVSNVKDFKGGQPQQLYAPKLGKLSTYHGVLSESADLLDGARGTLLEGDTVHLLFANIY